MRPIIAAMPLTALAFGLATPALGQSSPAQAPAAPAVPAADLQPRVENDRQIYEVAQFARFAPQTALDLVSEIPGFTIAAISTDRGLGEPSQNVLINGQRITGKSNDAETTLARIPVSTVVRLEIADAATMNVSGITGQVLNVVTRADALQGNFVWRGRVRSRIAPMFTSAEIGISGRLGQGSFTLGLSNNDAVRAGGWGDDISRDADGDLLAARSIFNYYHQDRPRIAATYSLTTDAGSIMNASVALDRFRTRRRAEFDVSVPGLAPSTEISSGREDGWNFEGGADYDFALGGGRLKLIAFHRSGDLPSSSLFRRDFTNGDPATGERFDQTINSGESVLRSEYRWATGASNWQLSLEGAYNYFDRSSTLFQLVNGNFIPQVFNGATARVDELRAQAIATYARPLSDELSLEVSLGGEFSQLSQTGAGGLTRSFIRPKGSVALTWTASPVFSLSSRIHRRVGQLSFGSFLASVNVQNNISNAANPQLVPSQSWLWENEARWSLGDAGSIRFNLQGELISDLVDQIAIGPDAEGVGNLPGTAMRLRGELNGSFVLDSIGFDGAKLDLVLAYQTTNVRDALLIERPLSARGVGYWSVSFRQDIPRTDVAWGFSGEDDDETPFYRLDYQSREITTNFTTSFYVEHKDVMGLRIRLTLQNLLNQRERQLETYYVNRRDGPIAFTRNASFQWGPMLRVSVSGTF